MSTVRNQKRSTRSGKIRRENLKPGECLCDHCTGKCCRYFSLPIRTPASWDDYDEIRWYLAHGQTIVYVDKATWYLLVMSRCQYLQADNRCGIYNDRPKICREYTTDDCEYDTEWTFERLFESPAQIWEYAEALLPVRRKSAMDAQAPSPPSQVVTTIGFSPAASSRVGN